MEIEKGKTYKYLKEKRTVSESATENLKNFTRIKKSLLDALKDEDLSVEQLSVKTGLPSDRVVFYLMTLVKYGYVQTGAIDDMDEYYYYKLKK